MKSLIIFLALVVGSAVLANPVEQVRCREIAFSISVETQDVALFTSFIDADARFVGNSVVHGPKSIAEAWSAFFAEGGPDIKWRPRFVEVLEDGKLALTRRRGLWPRLVFVAAGRRSRAPTITKWGGRWDSNPRRPGSQPGALPAELRPPLNYLAYLTPCLAIWRARQDSNLQPPD